MNGGIYRCSAAADSILWPIRRSLLSVDSIRETSAGGTWDKTDDSEPMASDGVLQLSLFDQQNLAEITHPDYPGERLIACRNPLLAAERARKREELLVATEAALKEVQAATQRAKRALRGEAAIGLRVGRVLGRYKMAKHFRLLVHLAASARNSRCDCVRDCNHSHREARRKITRVLIHNECCATSRR
jgi:hypothetical protein